MVIVSMPSVIMHGVIMLRVIMINFVVPSVIMPGVIMINVVMLSVVAPFLALQAKQLEGGTYCIIFVYFFQSAVSHSGKTNLD